MDLNPFPPSDWKLETGPYELADYCRSQGTDILVLLNAWLDPGHEPDDEPSWTTLQYWAARLRPLWYSHSGTEANLVASSSSSSKTTTVVMCNRTGAENGGYTNHYRGVTEWLMSITRNNLRGHISYILFESSTRKT